VHKVMRWAEHCVQKVLCYMVCLEVQCCVCCSAGAKLELCQPTTVEAAAQQCSSVRLKLHSPAGGHKRGLGLYSRPV
jgi:hypothetical protein